MNSLWSNSISRLSLHFANIFYAFYLRPFKYEPNKEKWISVMFIVVRVFKNSFVIEPGSIEIVGSIDSEVFVFGNNDFNFKTILEHAELFELFSHFEIGRGKFCISQKGFPCIDI